MNVIARLEYELAYYDSAVHRFNHYKDTPLHDLNFFGYLICEPQTSTYQNIAKHFLLALFLSLILFIVPLKIDQSTYLSSNISSTKNDVSVRIVKMWIATDRLSIIWKSNLSDNMKREFFQVVAVLVLLYGCTFWTLMKCLEKKLKFCVLFWTNDDDDDDDDDDDGICYLRYPFCIFNLRNENTKFSKRLSKKLIIVFNSDFTSTKLDSTKILIFIKQRLALETRP